MRMWHGRDLSRPRGPSGVLMHVPYEGFAGNKGIHDTGLCRNDMIPFLFFGHQYHTFASKYMRSGYLDPQNCSTALPPAAGCANAAVLLVPF